ncbi:serine/arginine repetitive matrix protein 1-like [Manduca sexta]|uniref:serine/arginine repetitive matrix protein 1-like n=1 Tax=Manduca sexta TaxID=7130 RepID=UPI0018904F1F|nr:serine/arginine repetitive matrix protein 1-like [Manduca sexta]
MRASNREKTREAPRLQRSRHQAPKSKKGGRKEPAGQPAPEPRPLPPAPALNGDAMGRGGQKEEEGEADSSAVNQPVGKYVGLRKAQLERDKLQREEAKKKADKELEDRLHFVKSPIPPKVSDTEDEDRPVLREDLRQYVDQPESAAIALFESEAKKWQENCARLEANMKTIQEENTALKRRLEELEAAAKGPTTEEMLAMVEARVQASNGVDPHGPSATATAGTRKKTTPGDVQLPRSAASRSGPFYCGGVDTAMAPARRREKSAAAVKKSAPGSKPKKGGRKEPAVQPAPEPRPLPPAPASMETPWVEVARRKKRRGSRQQRQQISAQPPKPTRRKEPKLRPPRSAAVVISLTPAAVAKGLTYKGVLTDAQNRVDLTGLDISRLKPKFTATVPAGEAEVGGCKPNDVDEVQESAAERPMEVAAEFTRPFDSFGIDSESSESMSSVRSKKFWRRHSRSKESEICLTSETDEPAPKAVTTDGRGRGRPPSTGHYAGLKKAQKELDARRREQSRQRMEKELEDQLRQEKRPVTSKRMDIEEPRVISKEDLLHCGHMPESELMARLEKEAREWKERGAQLAESVKKLQEENSSLRRRLEELEASASKPSTEEVLAMIEARVQARMESIQMGPAQRPPLAHERRTTGDTQLPVADGIVGGAQSKQPKGKGIGKKSAKPAPAPAPAPTIPVPVAGPSSAPPQVIAGPSSATAAVTPTTAPTARKNREKNGAPEKRKAPGPKTRKGGKKGQAVQPAPEPRPLPPAPASMDTPWVVVAKKSKKGKPATAQAANAQPPQPTRRAEPKLRPPRSAAVIISLTPSAVAKGLSYKQVLTDAQARVDLTGLDISRLRPKLRECLGSEDVKVSRPTKTVELRLTELDYTATPESVAAALSKAGECSSELIKVGQIRPDRDTDEPAPKSQTTDSRGRGRPPSVGKYVGRLGAQLERDKLQREEAKKKADKELEDRLHFVKSPILPKASETEDEDRPVLRRGPRAPEQRSLPSGVENGEKWQENSARLEANMKLFKRRIQPSAAGSRN